MALEKQTLTEFFREGMDKAQRNQKVALQEVTQFYVVNLLAEFLEAKKLHPGVESKSPDEPLAITYSRALETSDPHVQIRLLKSIGDRSLYVSGFFGDSFRRKLVDIDYYIAMGGHAYQFVSSLSKDRRQGDLFSEVFTELSQKFSNLVELISEISQTAGLTSDQDLLRLYERWLHTKSERLSELLRGKGITLVDQTREPIH